MEELDKRKKAASESSARRDALSTAGSSSSHGNNANKHRSRTEHMDPAARRDITRALNTSFRTMDPAARRDARRERQRHAENTAGCDHGGHHIPCIAPTSGG